MEINIMGIYQIENQSNGKVYIGSSKDITKRWKQHVNALKKNKHHSKHLQRAWNKYGEDNFKFNIIEVVYDEDLLLNAEQKWINKTKCYDGNCGYNISMDSNRPNVNKNDYSHLNCNLVFRDKVMDLINMDLKNNEKLVYYILRDFVSYPSNAVLINDEIPTMEQLEPIIGMKERAIRRAIKGLEDNNLIKGKRIGARKMLVFNPFYYASGKDLDIDSLKIFDLLDYDESKVEEYLNQDY